MIPLVVAALVILAFYVISFIGKMNRDEVVLPAHADQIQADEIESIDFYWRPG